MLGDGRLFSFRHATPFASFSASWFPRRKRNFHENGGDHGGRWNYHASSQHPGGGLLLASAIPKQEIVRYIHTVLCFVDIMLPEELLGKADIPRIIIISVSITGVILLLFNVLLVACFILRKKNKKVKKGMFSIRRQFYFVQI